MNGLYDVITANPAQRSIGLRRYIGQIMHRNQQAVQMACIQFSILLLLLHLSIFIFYGAYSALWEWKDNKKTRIKRDKQQS